MIKFQELLGKTLTSANGVVGSDEIVFITNEGKSFKLYHYQECCEDVLIESIVGDLSDLIGTPILLAEESSSGETPDGFEHEYEPESQTWTFYKLATIKGYVDIRWFGSSNGYYGESVDFEEIPND